MAIYNTSHALYFKTLDHTNQIVKKFVTQVKMIENILTVTEFKYDTHFGLETSEQVINILWGLRFVSLFLVKGSFCYRRQQELHVPNLSGVCPGSGQITRCSGC